MRKLRILATAKRGEERAQSDLTCINLARNVCFQGKRASAFGWTLVPLRVEAV